MKKLIILLFVAVSLYAQPTAVVNYYMKKDSLGRERLTLVNEDNPLPTKIVGSDREILLQIKDMLNNGSNNNGSNNSSSNETWVNFFNYGFIALTSDSTIFFRLYPSYYYPNMPFEPDFKGASIRYKYKGRDDYEYDIISTITLGNTDFFTVYTTKKFNIRGIVLPSIEVLVPAAIKDYDNVFSGQWISLADIGTITVTGGLSNTLTAVTIQHANNNNNLFQVGGNINYTVRYKSKPVGPNNFIPDTYRYDMIESVTTVTNTTIKFNLKNYYPYYGNNVHFLNFSSIQVLFPPTTVAPQNISWSFMSEQDIDIALDGTHIDFFDSRNILETGEMLKIVYTDDSDEDITEIEESNIEENIEIINLTTPLKKRGRHNVRIYRKENVVVED